MPVSAHVSTAPGQAMRVTEGTQLVFGRGPGVDLAIAAGRGLSRRAGVVTAMAAGVLIGNISRTHALYVEGDGYRISLPRLGTGGEPPAGWVLRSGKGFVGSRAPPADREPPPLTGPGQTHPRAQTGPH